MSNSTDPDETAHMSKSLLSLVAVKVHSCVSEVNSSIVEFEHIHYCKQGCQWKIKNIWSYTVCMFACFGLLSWKGQHIFLLNKLSRYILEESNFNFRYVRLCELDIPREKWLNDLKSDAAESGSALFANHPFRGFQTKQHLAFGQTSISNDYDLVFYIPFNIIQVILRW